MSRRLFLDDLHIASRHNLVRSFHQPVKHPAGPVLVPDRPWERSIGHNFGTVLHEDGRFRYWYQSYSLPSETLGVTHAAYAESTDGIHWTKPDLGLVSLPGHPATNLVATDVGWVNVIRDARDPDPARRYKLFSYVSGKDKPGAYNGWMGQRGHWGWGALFSPDGLRWTRDPENPLLTDAKDAATLYGWDERHQRYVTYIMPPPPSREGGEHAPRYRYVGRSASPDFATWDPVQTIITPDEHDPPGIEFYAFAAFPYQGLYLGLLYMLYTHPDERPTRMKGFMDTQLAVSRDGIAWTRLGGHHPFLPRGPRGAFDMAMVGPNNGLVEKDGLLWFFYNAWSGEHNETKAYRRGNDPGLWEMGRLASATGLAQLRLDGFISLDAGPDEGSLTTPTERLAPSHLVLNAATTSPSGAVTAELLDPTGAPLEGFAAAQCDPFRGDSLAHTLTWQGRSAAALGERPVSIRFTLRDASLYSYALGAA